MKFLVKVKPKAKEEKVVRREDGGYEVWVKAPPIEGRVNKSAARALADFFGVSKSAVCLTRGAKSKQKVFEIK